MGISWIGNLADRVQEIEMLERSKPNSRTVFIVEDGILIKYAREGECLACGDCCRKFNYDYQYTTTPKGQSGNGEGDWNKWEGWAIEDWDKDGEWHWWGPVKIIPLDEPRCSLFCLETNHCLNFKKQNWREVCRKFPFRPADLNGLENCGFIFRKIG